jgi:hypothetical protein
MVYVIFPAAASSLRYEAVSRLAWKINSPALTISRYKRDSLQVGSLGIASKFTGKKSLDAGFDCGINVCLLFRQCGGTDKRDHSFDAYPVSSAISGAVPAKAFFRAAGSEGSA